MKYFRYSLIAFFAPFVPLVSLAAGVGTGGIGIDNPLKGFGSLQAFVEAVLNNIVLPIGSIIVVIFIIYSGFLFVTARGNENKLEEAKHSLLAVVIGAAILLGALTISSVISGTVCQLAPNLPNCRTIGR